MDEAELGYPEHAWLAVGHLAEAESELLANYPELAHEVRRHRLEYINGLLGVSSAYAVPVIDLIAEISALDGPADIEVDLPEDEG